MFIAFKKQLRVFYIEKEEVGGLGAMQMSSVNISPQYVNNNNNGNNQ